MNMKILLNFVDLSEESAKVIVDWLKGIIADKDPENLSPLRYVDSMEINYEPTKD